MNKPEGKPYGNNFIYNIYSPNKLSKFIVPTYSNLKKEEPPPLGNLSKTSEKGFVENIYSPNKLSKPLSDENNEEINMPHVRLPIKETPEIIGEEHKLDDLLSKDINGYSSPYNVFSSIVSKQFDDYLLESHNVCSCVKCRVDIMALSLKNLPKIYITDQTNIESKVELISRKYHKKIYKALLRAIEKVKENPSDECKHVKQRKSSSLSIDEQYYE